MSQQSSGMRAGPSAYTMDEPVDTNPSDVQPPGVDEEPDYNSLEEALAGWSRKRGPSESDLSFIGFGPVRRIPLAV